jgi:hypothetical protein
MSEVKPKTGPSTAQGSLINSDCLRVMFLQPRESYVTTDCYTDIKSEEEKTLEEINEEINGHPNKSRIIELIT